MTYSVWGLFGLTVFSGIFLAVHYIPAFSQAFSSVVRLNEEVPFGWMARRLHAAGGSLLLLLFLFHLLRVFYSGDYKVRPRMAWVLEILLLFCALWIEFHWIVPSPFSGCVLGNNHDPFKCFILALDRKGDR